MPTTHIKLFVSGGQRQVALFSGPDEAHDWLRNCAADELLSGGWHLLPKEELISLTEVEERGFLRATTGQNDQLCNWQLRSADLRVRLAAQAAEQGDHALEAAHAEAAAGQLAQLSNDVRIVALLLQAVEARLKLWRDSQDPAQASAIARLFGILSSCSWPAGDSDGQSESRQNQDFWLNKALRRHAELAVELESNGDLLSAALSIEAGIDIQIDASRQYSLKK